MMPQRISKVSVGKAHVGKVHVRYSLRAAGRKAPERQGGWARLDAQMYVATGLVPRTFQRV